MAPKPKKKCCVSKPRCRRCPLRMLAEGTLPDGYTVMHRKLVKVGKGKPGAALKPVETGKAAKPGKGAKPGKAAKLGKGAKPAKDGKPGKAGKRPRPAEKAQLAKVKV